MRIPTLRTLFPTAFAAAATLVLAAGSTPAEAAFPGLNGKIAYSDGGFIHSISPDGSGLLQLTSGEDDHEPAWSPDGKKIAFTSYRYAGGDIHVINATGSGQTHLTNDSLGGSEPAWSPDGKEIAFRRLGDIYVMNADGSNKRRLTQSGGNVQPAWSPDGQKIALASYRDGNGEIYVMNADGTGQTRLTHNAAEEFEPEWSPDGQKVAFTNYGDGKGEIYVMNADGSGQTRLTYNAARDRGSAWSPDGQKIAFTYNDYEHGVFSGIYFMNTDGSARTRVADGYEPDWQRAFPRPELTVFPGSTTIELGTLRSGSAASLMADDNAYFEVSSKITSKSPSTSETSWYGILTLPNELMSLRLGYTGKNSRTCMQQLELRDFDTGSWVVVDRRGVGTNEVQAVIETPTALGLADVKALRRFVSGSSGPGELHLRVRTGCDAAFVSSGELMQVVYTQP